ncbi:MAG: hypothetical protein N2Z62_11040 [Rhodobacteraceae bacterium]|nr:hypothetical protein [Paracoccaceae bacterium]
MSNTTDSFIDEVTEEVRRDRLFRILRRYGWIGILAVLLLVGGAALTEWRRASERAAAQAAGDAIYAVLRQDDPAARAEGLAGLGVAGPGAAPVMMLQAANLAEAGETARAAEVYAALAADTGHPRVWRDLAALKRVLLLGRSLTPAERLAALAPLTEPGAPFRVLAQEQEAYARIDAGETEAARALLDALMADREASLGLRLRAAQMMVALGEDGAG